MSIPDQSDQSGVAHWYAPVEDTTGAHKDSRFGTIPYQSDGPLVTSAANKYLDFKLYYDYDDTPTAKCIYLELVDDKSEEDQETGYPESYTETQSLRKTTWNTLTVDLSKLSGAPDFNYSQDKIHQI